MDQVKEKFLNLRAIRALGVFLVGLLTTSIWFFLYWIDMAPVVLQDELLFAYLSVVDPTLSPYSNSLFSSVYSLSGSCGDDFLTCGKTLNFVFWLGVIIVFSGWTYASNKTSVMLISMWSSSSVVSFYVGTFLPEVFYYFLVTLGLSLMGYAIFHQKRILTFGAVSGLVFGLAMLVKPHAFFVVIFATFAAAIGLLIVGGLNRSVILFGILTPVSAVVSRITIDFILGGSYPLNIFASYLGGQSDPGPNFSADFPIEQPELASLNSTVFELALSTLMPYLAVGLIFYVPAFVYALVRLLKKTDQEHWAISTFMVSSAALGMLAVSWAFGVRATLVGDDHTDRVLLRYSEYLIPFVLIMLTALITKERDRERSWVFGLIPVAAGTIMILSGALAGISLQAADSLFIFSLSGFFLWQLLVVVGLALLFVSGISSSTTLKTVTTSTLTLGLFVSSLVHLQGQSSYYVEERGEYSEILAAAEDLPEDKLVFVGSQRAVISFLVLESGKFDSKYGLISGYSQIPEEWLSEYDYALITQEIYPPSNSREITTIGSNSLYELRSEPNIEQALYSESPDVESFSNVGVITEWGYWVDGDTSEIVFRDNLEAGSKVVLQLIRHQATNDEFIQVQVDDEQPIDAQLDVAGRIFELELNVGLNGMKRLKLSYDDNFQILFNEGMSNYSFGVSRIEVTRD